MSATRIAQRVRDLEHLSIQIQPLASRLPLRYREVMSAATVDAIKEAITRLPERERASLAHWLNVSVIREELASADDQISRGEGIEYDEQNLPKLFAETKASALQLLREKAKHS